MTDDQPIGEGGKSAKSREDESTKKRVDRLIAEGKIDPDVVSNAERLWNERLANGVILPTGGMAIITLSDLYHVIVDNRIGRKPERIELMLTGIVEIRTTKLDRRIALARWSEEKRVLVGLIILEPDNRLRSLHVVDDKRIRREQRIRNRTMETTRAYIFWTGPENDVLMLLREPTPLWLADPVDDEYQFLILLTLDEHEEETGEVTGIKILDFLKFDRWGEIPEFPILWKLKDRKPRSMIELLKRVQIECRKEAETLISAD